MEVSKLFLGFLIVLQINENHAQTCDQITYTTIKDVRRSAAYKRTGNTKLCDRGYIKNDNWYRFDSVAGNTIPTTNPGNGFCGTHVPIWLQGTHPIQVNVVVDAKACAAIPFIEPLGCGISYNIKIIKCGSYYLYRLKEPRQCDLAYCAGDKLPQTSCSVTGETLPVCPGAIPRVSVGVGFKDENLEEVRLRCFWESGGNLTNVEYQARWYGDIRDLKPKIQRNFTGLEFPEFLFGSPVVNSKRNKNGYEFHKNVYCAVRARYKTGTWSKWVASKRIYTGIQVSPKFIPINDCGERDREVIITLRPNLPIRVKPINIDIVSPTSKLKDEICVVGEKAGFSDCGLVFQPNHRVGRPIRFKLMTSCGTGDKSTTLDGTYDLQHSFHKLDDINKFWVNHPFPVIKISRRKFKKQQCRSTGDPHFETFDGRRYDFYGRGTFLLYRNKFYGTEIQVRQRACNGGTPSCNCGIAIRENLFYKIYDMCYATPGRPWWQNNVRSRMYTYQLRDFKLSRFYSRIKQQGSTAKYEITLPSGVKVIVDRQNWGLNLYVWAPADPDHLSEGLCGNNNENPNDDFGQWKTANQFGEDMRIRTYVTQFDYKGNKFEEDQLDDGCDKKICVCSRGSPKLCGSDAEQICFPDLGSKDARAHHRGSGIGECANRPKRALTPDDDTVDNQDSIPSFNPTIKNVNLTLTWPTPSGITKANVTQFCEKKLLYSKAGQACGQVRGVNVDSLVQQCITDIQATEDFSWAAGNFAALETSCIANIFNNISSFKNTTDGSIQLDTDVLTSLCPNDCSDHGECSNSTCTCHEDYTAADCSISLKDSPLVFDIRKSGLCDRRRRPCRNVGIFGSPLLDSENLTCHVQEHKVINSTWSPSNSISLYPGQLVDLTEVKCALPESPVNIGDYGNEGVTAAGLKIAISNNRVNASKESMLFITYDSVCQDCNATTGCTLRTDACFISGHCFATNDSNPLDWCQQCLPEMSTSSWSQRIDNKEPTFTTSQVLYAFKGKQLRVQLSAVDPENRAIQYSFAQNETFGASLTKDGLFNWTKNTNDSTVFIFNVTDECGAYSVLKTTVVIKQCPCQNSGECFPDYRYLDGAGNFTCSCPDQYTGTLCEDDVDECVVSKPCNNGTCKNEQPGFACSCFAGYTGQRCQIEIDECTSNPCFLGLTCTDKVAGYRCGACPSGYSGNGENCTRVDGKTDECIKNPKVCHSDAKCGYHNGSYVCQCIDGYTGDGKINCTDINECKISKDLCPQNSTCFNHRGSYGCRCNEGYTGDGTTNCTDIDECVMPSKACHLHANCSNVVGSFSCQCRDGYSGDGKHNCTDIDECQQSPCHHLASCSNTEGTYSCQCRNGYNGDGHKNCTDMNECLQIPNVCHPHANCSNVHGSFSCQCRDGYTGDGKMNCTDIDECQQSPCHHLANCSNIEGAYSCQCINGYLGDGLMNCTENQPPQFSTPNAVYAILNEHFRIQIKAVDPESQDLTCSLISNGTLTTAQVTKQGLLTISSVKGNGTVFVQVEDEMGAKNVLVLHVSTMQCPCKHNGKCSQKKNILYPVQPSDYFCQCEEPYTGDYCETRPNPCDEEPCYPGLKCSSAQNSEGFSCEECPPLFEGDGKNCELKPNQEKTSVASKMKLTNQAWSEQLKKKTSKEYKNLVSQLITEIRKLYQHFAGFSYVIIKRLSRGSVIVVFELIFTKDVVNPLQPLNKVAETGKLGNMTFKMVDLDDKDDASKEDRILGLDRTIFIVIVVAVVVLILMIIFAVCLRKRRRSHRGDVRLNKYVPHIIANNPEATFNETEKPGSDEEIDLKVFHKDTVCVEEKIKLAP